MQISDFVNVNANDLQFGKKFVFRWTKRTCRILCLWEMQCQCNERLIFSEREKSHFLFLFKNNLVPSSLPQAFLRVGMHMDHMV